MAPKLLDALLDRRVGGTGTAAAANQTLLPEGR
jgi:hypothetical protein